MNKKLNEVILKSNEHLKFKDFRNLKSGRDKYSNMRIDQLAELIDVDDFCELFFVLEYEDYVASACRWILRGLCFEKALRKVAVDIEVSLNAKCSPKNWKNR